MANMFNVEIVVISTLGEGGRVIDPTNCESDSDIGNDYTGVSDIQSKSVANPDADSDYEPDADIENDVAVPDIQPDSTNEQESDDSGLILEKKVGNSLLDLLRMEILEKVFLDA